MIKLLVSFFTLRITGKGLLFAAITMISIMASLVLLAVLIIKPNYPSLPEEQKFAKWISGYETGISYNLEGVYHAKESHYFKIRFDHVAITDEDIKNYILPLHVTEVELNHTEVTCTGVALLCDNPYIKSINYNGTDYDIRDQEVRKIIKTELLSRDRVIYTRENMREDRKKEKDGIGEKIDEENAEKIENVEPVRTTASSDS